MESLDLGNSQISNSRALTLDLPLGCPAGHPRIRFREESFGVTAPHPGMEGEHAEFILALERGAKELRWLSAGPERLGDGELHANQAQASVARRLVDQRVRAV